VPDQSLRSAVFGPEGAILFHKGFIPGFSGVFPEAVTGWTTMVVTAAVYFEFEDPNGGITN
jgi:hypothetical protein